MIANFRTLMWEPVAGTGEKLMAGVIVDFDGHLSAHRILRDDMLDNLFGKQSIAPKKLIDTSLEALLDLAGAVGLKDLMPVFGIFPGELRTIQANNLAEAVRISALMYSSLANLNKIDELEVDDAPSQEDTNRRFSTEIRDAVDDINPLLTQYFNRSAKLLNDGLDVKFGFLSHRAILHFGVINPNRQTSGVRDARARLWELAQAKDYSSINNAALIIAAPRSDDPTLSAKQLKSVLENLYEIEREADANTLRLYQVNTSLEGAKRVIELAQ